MHEPNKAKRYTPEFKTRALNLLATDGSTTSGVARDLGISYSALLKWKEGHMANQRSQQQKAKPKVKDLEEQLRQLQRENQSLRNQRDILKKSWASFPWTHRRKIRPNESPCDGLPNH